MAIIGIDSIMNETRLEWLSGVPVVLACARLGSSTAVARELATTTAAAYIVGFILLSQAACYRSYISPARDTGDRLPPTGDSSPTDSGDEVLTGGMTLNDFVIDEVTPNTLRVNWWPVGVPRGFRGYEVWYGTEATAVAEMRAPASSWAVQNDPNLGSLIRRAAQVVRHSRVTGLSAATTYFAKVVVVGEGILSETSVLSVTTPEVPQNIVYIYRDSWTAGWSIDADWANVSSDASHPFSGGESLKLSIAARAAGQGTGFPFHYGGININVEGITEAALSGAYLEFAIDCESGAVDYGETVLFGPNEIEWRYAYPSYYVCTRGYDVMQLPLRGFYRAGQPVSIADLGGRVNQFLIYGGWQVGDIYIDEISLRFP